MILPYRLTTADGRAHIFDTFAEVLLFLLDECFDGDDL